nr:hypothetical protein Itr_chr14CG16610 [Ipomoea trifida]
MLDHRTSSLPSLREEARRICLTMLLVSPSLQPLTTARTPLLLLDVVVDQEARGRRRPLVCLPEIADASRVLHRSGSRLLSRNIVDHSLLPPSIRKGEGRRRQVLAFAAGDAP